MQWQFAPYLLPLLITTAIAVVLAVIAWQRRAIPGALPIALLMLAVSWWSAAYALEIASVDLAPKLFWAKVQYIGIQAVPILWLIFVLIHTGREQLLTMPRLLLLAVVPLITVLLAWTNEAHGLIYEQTALDDSLSFTMLTLDHGPAFWMQGIYAYVLIFLGIALIVGGLQTGPRYYRRQNAALLAAAIVPIVGNILYLARLLPFPYLDLAPLAFAITGLIAAWALLRYRFLDLVPVARAALIEGMSDGVIVLDADDRIVDVNEAGRKLLVPQPDRAIGRAAAAAIPNWTTLQPSLEAADEGVEVALGEGTGRHFYDLRISRLADDRDHYSGRLLVWRDISERKRAEEAEHQQRALAEALRDAAAALSSTLSLEEVLDRILAEVAHVLPHDTSTIMLIEGQEARVVRSRGYEDERPTDWLSALRLPVENTRNLHEMATTASPMTIADIRDYPGWIPLPHQEWIRAYAGAPICSKGQVIGFLNLTSDRPGYFDDDQVQRLQSFADQAGIAIENARLVTSLRETNVRLQAAVQAREEMIQNVSHELRTPLTLLLAYSELMAMGELGALTEAQRDALHVMQQQGEQLQLMLNSLLTLQSFDPERLELTPLNLSAWLRNLLHPWQQRTAEVGLSMAVDLAPDTPPVLASDSYLRLVVENLLDNAVKFSPDGGLLRVSLYPQDDSVVLDVSDQGIGVPPGELEQIFQRFYQVDSTTARRFNGMGIGLALCHTIVAAHGGRIWAESPGEGHGSTFYVILPAARAPRREGD